MDANSLMLSILFGCIGMGMIVYGRKASRMVPAIAGLGLVVIPYFISSLLLMTIVCLAMMALPWVIRED